MNATRRDDDDDNDAQAASEREIRDSPPLREFLQNYRAEQNETPDVLEGRYRIELGTPLTPFDSTMAKAYAVSEQSGVMGNLYALVCTPGTYQRHMLIQQLKTFQHPNMCNIVASGIVAFSTPAEEKFVIVLERPRGQTLAAMLETAPRAQFNYPFIRDHVIAPVMAALQKLGELGFTHGSINPDTIYISDVTVIRECVSEPCGYSQKMIYESLDRIQASASGKDPYELTCDYYAMAVSVLKILSGLPHLQNVDEPMLVNEILLNGVYNTYLRDMELPEIYADLFRGLFSQSKNNRWNYEQLKAWISGKRFNLLVPSHPNESGRPFEFAGAVCGNRRAVAQLLFDHWDEAIKPLRDGSLIRWVDMGLRNRDVSEHLKAVLKPALEGGARSERSINEMIARTLVILDPEAPLRLRKLRLHLHGINATMAELSRMQAQAELQTLTEMIELDLASSWIDLIKVADEDLQQETMNVASKLDALRVIARQKGLGFGNERFLYELVPHMPCQSPLLAGYCASNVELLQIALDKLAAKNWQSKDPIDRHIAAYLCARLGIIKEVRLDSMDAYPQLINHKALVALLLLTHAQQRAQFPQLPGLSTWLANGLLPVLNLLHSKGLRTILLEKIQRVAPNGYFQPMLDLFGNAAHIAADARGFSTASRQYHHNKARIKALNSQDRLQQDIVKLGFTMAKTICYVGLLVSFGMAIQRLRL